MLLNHVNSLKEKVNILLNKLDELEVVNDSLKTKNDYLVSVNKELENKIKIIQGSFSEFSVRKFFRVKIYYFFFSFYFS